MARIEELSSRERAILFALAAHGGPISNPDLERSTGLRLDGQERIRLTAMNLVLSERPGRAYVHALTDEGWTACRVLAVAEPAPRSTAAEKGFYALLSSLDSYLTRTGQQLRDLFTGPENENSTLTSDEEDRVVSAYQRVASAPGEFVRLVDVRAGLADMPRVTADAVLATLFRAHRINLVPASNQRSLSPADRQAALRIGGEDKHLIAIGGS